MSLANENHRESQENQRRVKIKILMMKEVLQKQDPVQRKVVGQNQENLNQRKKLVEVLQAQG